MVSLYVAVLEKKIAAIKRIHEYGGKKQFIWFCGHALRLIVTRDNLSHIRTKMLQIDKRLLFIMAAKLDQIELYLV